ncbi:MAG: recombinase family protein [Eubacterium sp.]|nr:recombinase family protein [Eubacterium sp.]
MLKNRSIPFGFCVVNGRFAINEIEAEAVRKIFADYISGASLKSIADKIEIPYNSGKEKWNKNMVCRVLENKKYLGENGYPKIISRDDFEAAARIKSERNTYRKPAPEADLRESDNRGKSEFIYEQSDEIRRINSEINRLLDSENPDKKSIEKLIFKCAELKYSAITEVKK